MTKEKQDNKQTTSKPLKQETTQKSTFSKAKWLSFEYLLAMGSLVASTLLMVSILESLFGGWAGGKTMLATQVGGWTASLLSLGMATKGTGVIVASVMAVMLAMIALVCFDRVTKALPDRIGYTKRMVYKLITYGAFAMLFILALVLVAKLITVLVSSLLFIGVAGAGAIYKSLYVAEFLPYLLGLSLIVAIGVCLAKIIQGKNVSQISAIIAVACSMMIFTASAITVGVQSHETSKTLRSGYSKYWDELGF